MREAFQNALYILSGYYFLSEACKAINFLVTSLKSCSGQLYVLSIYEPALSTSSYIFVNFGDYIGTKFMY